MTIQEDGDSDDDEGDEDEDDEPEDDTADVVAGLSGEDE